jgi:hypothetical protein
MPQIVAAARLLPASKIRLAGCLKTLRLHPVLLLLNEWQFAKVVIITLTKKHVKSANVLCL